MLDRFWTDMDQDKIHLTGLPELIEISSVVSDEIRSVWPCTKKRVFCVSAAPLDHVVHTCGAT
jgi:hypothetical protein